MCKLSILGNWNTRENFLHFHPSYQFYIKYIVEQTAKSRIFFDNIVESILWVLGRIVRHNPWWRTSLPERLQASWTVCLCVGMRVWWECDSWVINTATWSHPPPQFLSSDPLRAAQTLSPSQISTHLLFCSLRVNDDTHSVSSSLPSLILNRY